MNSEYYYNGIQGIPILPEEAEYRDQIFKLRDQQYKASEAAEQEAREALYEPGVSPYVVEQDLINRSMAQNH